MTTLPDKITVTRQELRAIAVHLGHIAAHADERIAMHVRAISDAVKEMIKRNDQTAWVVDHSISAGGLSVWDVDCDGVRYRATLRGGVIIDLYEVIFDDHSGTREVSWLEVDAHVIGAAAANRITAAAMAAINEVMEVA